MNAKWGLIAIAAAVVGAVLGVGAGYLAWGVPKDWYAGHDPAKLPASPENDLIRYGWDLVVNTPRFIGKTAEDPAKRFAGNDLACTNCHINAGLRPFAAPFVSTFATYPMMVGDIVESLFERLNGCMMRSMNGSPLPEGSREMQALIAYIRFVGEGSPQGVRVAGMGLATLPSPAQKPDAANGEQVYAKTCARCHGANGEGDPRTPPAVGYATPPLWGDKSFNAGAGMSKIELAAAFIRANMPPGASAESALMSEQDAWNVAAFVTTRPRPPAPADSPPRPSGL